MKKTAETVRCSCVAGELVAVNQVVGGPRLRELLVMKSNDRQKQEELGPAPQMQGAAACHKPICGIFSFSLWPRL